MALRVPRQQTPGSRERAVMADRGECIAQFAIFRSGIARAIGRENGKMQRPRNGNRSAIARLFFTMEMPLQFHIHIAAAK